MTDELLFDGESQTVEYKRARPESSKSYLKTVAAFANAHGGTLVFGIDDKTHEVIGIPDGQVFNDMDAISNTIMDSIEPEIVPNISTQTLEGKPHIVVEVPFGPRCPYYLKSEGMEGGVYVRVGATTRQADLEWARILAVEYSERGYDRTVCRGRTASREEIDDLCSRMYETALSRCRNDEERHSVRKAGIPQLCSWGILAERDGDILPVNAFFLLAGTAFDMPLVQCAIFRGTSRAVFLDRQEFDGTLADQIEQAYAWVKQKINVGADLNGVVRRDVYELPLWPVREIITNAVLHRTYLSSGNVQVALYDDRLEISSPGGIPRGLTMQQALDGRSEFRNKGLAQAFHYMKLVEGWGSGIPRVISETIAYGLKPPEFIDMGGTIRVNFFRPTAEEFESILRKGEGTSSSDAKIADRPPIAADRPPIAEDRYQIIEELLSSGIDVGTAEISEALGLSMRRTREILQQLVKEGVLEKHSDRRYAHYTLAWKENAE